MFGRARGSEQCGQPGITVSPKRVLGDTVRGVRHGAIETLRPSGPAQTRGANTVVVSERLAKLRSVLHYSGLPIDARTITDDLLAQEGYEVAKKTAVRAPGAGMTGGE